MRLLFLIFILFFSFPILQGQSNTEDLDQALQLLCDSPAAEPFFQADTDEGQSMLLVYSEARTRPGVINISENLKAIRYELATNFYCPIVIISEIEYQQYDFRSSPQTILFYRIRGDQMNLILTTKLLSNSEAYQVDFNLEKQFDQWKIVRSNVVSTRR